MGLNIQIKDAVFTKSIGLLLPFSSNLVGYWTFNSTRDEAIKNNVTGVVGTLVGNPIVSDGKIATDRANGFITDIAISGEKTFITIAKTSSAAVLLSSTDYDRTGTPTSEGIAVFNSAPIVQLNGASNPKALGVVNLNTIHFIAGALGVSSNSLYVSSGGALQETVGSAHNGSLDDPNKLRIGGWGVVSTALVGSTETYAALVYNKKLSATEVQTVFDYLKREFGSVVID